MAGEVPNILEEIQKLVDKSAELDKAGKADEADKLVEKIKDLGGNFVTKARKLTEEGLNADEGGHKEEAVRLYREAVGICLEAAKTTQDREMKRKFSKLAGDALERAEMVKEQVEEDFRSKKNSFKIKDGGKKIKSDVEALATHYDQFRKRMEAEDAARKAEEDASKEEPEGGGDGKIKDKPGEHFKNVYPWNKLDKITCVHCKDSDTSAGQDDVDGSRVTKPAAAVQRNKSVKKLKDTFEKDSSCQCTTDESANEKAKDEKKDETKEFKDDNDLTRKKSMEKTKNKLENLNFTRNTNLKPGNLNKKFSEKEDSSIISLGVETNVEPLERKRSVKEAKSKLENLNFKAENINRKSSEKEEGSRISLGQELNVEPLERKRSVKEAKSKLEKINFCPISPNSLGEELGKGTSLARRRSMKETKNQLEKINLCPTRSLNFSPKSKPDLLTNMARSEGPGDHVESEDAVPELPAIPQLQHLAKNRPKRNKKHAATKSMVLLQQPPDGGESDDIKEGLDKFFTATAASPSLTPIASPHQVASPCLEDTHPSRLGSISSTSSSQNVSPSLAHARSREDLRPPGRKTSSLIDLAAGRRSPADDLGGGGGGGGGSSGGGGGGKHRGGLSCLMSQTLDEDMEPVSRSPEKKPLLSPSGRSISDIFGKVAQEKVAKSRGLDITPPGTSPFTTRRSETEIFTSKRRSFFNSDGVEIRSQDKSPDSESLATSPDSDVVKRPKGVGLGGNVLAEMKSRQEKRASVVPRTDTVDGVEVRSDKEVEENPFGQVKLRPVSQRF